MDIRDYIRMLKRGWPTIALVALCGLGLAGVYLAITPKSYETTATVLITTRNPATITELQLGGQFALAAAPGYAQIIDSAKVLGPVGNALPVPRNPDDLAAMITATAHTQAPIIDVTVTGDNPQFVADLANAVVDEAAVILPGLQKGKGDALVQVQVVRVATVPTAPVGPLGSRILVIGAMVGLVVGLGLALVAQALDTRIRRVEDLHRLASMPVLAALPRARRAESTLVARSDPTGVGADAYRALRTTVRFLDPADRGSLLVLGVGADIGAGPIAVNLAWMLAEAGESVVLVDLDLRQPTVGDALRIGSRFGMSDVLAGDMTVQEAIQASAHPNLQLVLAGTSRPSPSELMGRPTLATALRHLESTCDYVIVHGPPLLRSSDGVVAARAVSGTLVTVSAGRTRAQELASALGVLANVEVRPKGLILTRTARPAARRRLAGSRSGAKRKLRRFDWDRQINRAR